MLRQRTNATIDACAVVADWRCENDSLEVRSDSNAFVAIARFLPMASPDDLLFQFRILYLAPSDRGMRKEDDEIAKNLDSELRRLERTVRVKGKQMFCSHWQSAI